MEAIYGGGGGGAAVFNWISLNKCKAETPWELLQLEALRLNATRSLGGGYQLKKTNKTYSMLNLSIVGLVKN